MESKEKMEMSVRMNAEEEREDGDECEDEWRGERKQLAGKEIGVREEKEI